MIAVWVYGPLDHQLSSYFCDNCVPRGCSCVLEPKEDVDFDDVNYTGEWVYQLDNEDRKLPCVEYEYCLNGFEDSDFY